MASDDNAVILTDLIPVHFTRSTAPQWYTAHKSSEDCGCIHESAGRWRLYWKTRSRVGGKEGDYANYGRTKEWKRAKLLHEWGINVNDDPGTGEMPGDQNTYGTWNGSATSHLIDAWQRYTGHTWGMSETDYKRPAAPAPPS